MADLPEVDPAVVADCAAFLRSLASDLRVVGDMTIVRVGDNGVAATGMTLSDMLWLTAARLGGGWVPLPDPDGPPAGVPEAGVEGPE